jgi:PAS domain S-box-containing protein
MSEHSNNKSPDERIKDLWKENRTLKRKLELAETNLARARQTTTVQDSIDSLWNSSLQKELQFFQLVLENATSTVLLLDFDGRFAYASRKFLKDADIAEFGLINGRHYEEVLHPIVENDSLGKFKEAVQAAIDKKGTVSYEDKINFNQKGDYRTYSILITPMFDKSTTDTDLMGIMAILNDISELKTTIKKQADAEAANLAKSAFLATMSHEIRTPMNAIIGITEMQMQKKYLTSDMAEAFDRIYTSATVLLHIINDLLDLSRIETGKLVLELKRYNVESMLNDTAQLNMVRIGSKPVDFKIEVSKDTPAELLGDELRIKQILNNILSNAFKYTESGEVILKVSAEVSQVTVILKIIVSDTGQGMTPEQIDVLFDEYTRFNIDTNRVVEGVGLGMNITQQLVKLMNGEIFVDSEVGKGTMFTVRLPQGNVGATALGKERSDDLSAFRTKQTTRTEKARIEHKQMPHATVLVVDDVKTNLFVARGLMIPYGMSVETVLSGNEAIEKIKSGKVYDVIFMDHMMPVMNGIETAAVIRQTGYQAPVVALTANAVQGQKEMFIENGFDDFLSKPINVNELDVVLRKWVKHE